MPPAFLTPATAYWLCVVWLFALGTAVGSFLNVVIYRVPAGRNIVRPGSHCPACNHTIRWHDNVPVVSWLLLRGRCRDCGGRISVRYPLVETVTGALFVLVGAREGFSGGANLPLEPSLSAAGTVLVSFGPAQLGGLVAYHLVLLCTLLAAAAIQYDGHPAPLRLFPPALAAGGLAPLVWPYLHPVPAWPQLGGPMAGLADSGIGFTVGLALGWAFRPVRDSQGNLAPLLGPSCVGLFLGWQAALVLMAVAVVLDLPLSAFRRLRPLVRLAVQTGWLTFGALTWILAWNAIVHRWPFLG
jgi:leader peptidase (prepilin peptidase)/N-methyltransferase